MADKLPAFIQTELEQARKAASSENAIFASDNETVIFNGAEVSLDKLIKERISLHHQTWIITRINRVLRWSAGEYKGGF